MRWDDEPLQYFETHFPDGVYDSPDTKNRRAIPFDEMEESAIVDENGQEIPWYTEDGFIIKRRAGMIARNTKPHGILLDLRGLSDMFISDDDLFGDDIPVYHVYPQAGLRTAGHFQAHGLMGACRDLVKKLNCKLSRSNDNQMDENQDFIRKPIVQGISSQGYNAVMHSTRGRNAHHHDVQVGMVTSRLAKSWASNASAKTTAARLTQRCAYSLPHQRFAEKTQNSNISRDLRLENVYSIDMDQLRRNQRNGR
jgi:hypothetical protein